MSETQHNQAPPDVNTVPEDQPFMTDRSGKVTSLEEHRAQRELAKLVPEEVETLVLSDPKLMEALLLGMKALARQERRNAKKEGGAEGGGQTATEGEDSLPLRYAWHFHACDEIRIGGSKSGGRTVYVWDLSEERWVAQTGDEARSHATKWLSQHAKSKADAARAKLCLETALDLYARDSAKRLPRQDPRHPILPVIGAYLRIGDDGTIRAERPYMQAGVTHRVPAKLDWSRVDPETGIYVPRPLPADSRLAQYLDKFMPDLDVRNLLQEAVGSSLMPAGGWHKAFCLTGGSASMFDDGSNGKSTLLKFLTALHPENVSVDLTTLDKDASAIADLEGKTLAISTETPDYLGKQVEQRLKAIIAGDEIRGRALYQNARYFDPLLQLWMAMNGGGIRFHDRSPAMEERFLYIPFNVRVPRDSADNIKNFSLLVTQDVEQMAVLLDWALEGVARLCRNGKRFSTKPACIRAADEARRMETDPTYAWLVESGLEASTTKETSKFAIYDLYKRNLNDGQSRPLGEAQFWRAVRGFIESRGKKLLDRLPSAPRHLPRPPRTCNLVMQGIPEKDYRWGEQPANAPSQDVLDRFRADTEPLF